MNNKSVSNKALETRRYLAVFLPLLPSERNKPKPPDTPFVLTEKKRGAVQIVAVDARALTLGLAPSMTLADMRARVPELVVIAHDLKDDAALLEWLAEGCDRYTPMVALDPPSGLILDITGCAHLFAEGETGLVADLSERLTRQGLTSRAACASTPDAAVALSQHGITDVCALPVSALRLSEDAHIALRRAGLHTIGALADRPRAPLAARFGEDAPALLSRLLGETDVRITPRRVPPDLVVEMRFAEPVARSNDMLGALDGLAQDAERLLSERGQGGRRFEASLFRSDGHVARLAIETGQPTRDSGLLNRLFRERIDSLSDPLDPGFGYDSIRLDVTVCEALDTAQQGLDETRSGADVDALIDRLGVRMGTQRVRRFASSDSHIPECAAYTTAAGAPALPLPWAQVEPGDPPLRPLHLFDPPQRVEVIAEVPDGPPRRFRWRRVTHDVVAHEGPERIAAEWWKRRGGGVSGSASGGTPGSASSGGLTRDYYRVENRQGQRFWLFRHGLYGSERPNPDWYVHGAFV